MLDQLLTSSTTTRRLQALLKAHTDLEGTAAALACPLFVCEGALELKGSMASTTRYPFDGLPERIDRLFESGIRTIALYAICDRRDNTGRESYNDSGLLQRSIASIKQHCPEITVISDVGLCQYTEHGHCGIAVGDVVDNDRTLEALTLQGLSHAAAGADILMPSSMMDGAVTSLRTALDENRYQHIPIVAQSIKFASTLFRPFQQNTAGLTQKIDKRSYQLDPLNLHQAIREAALDISEGAAMVMVKPAFGYLDVIKRVKSEFQAPTGAFCTSGEHIIMSNYIEGLIADDSSLTADGIWHRYISRIMAAGADMVVSYSAEHFMRHHRSGGELSASVK